MLTRLNNCTLFSPRKRQLDTCLYRNQVKLGFYIDNQTRRSIIKVLFRNSLLADEIQRGMDNHVNSNP